MITDTHYNVYELQKHTKWSKPDTTSYIWDSTCESSRIGKSRQRKVDGTFSRPFQAQVEVSKL